MPVRNKIKQFKKFCSEQYGLEIQDFIIEAYIQSAGKEHEDRTLPGSDNEDCAYKTSVCSHINFDTTKCDNCGY